MSEFVPPHQQLPNWSELSATGRGLGVINRKYFESATWEPLLSNEIGRGQYSKFVAAMIERIRVKESSLDEIRSFVHLIAVCTFRSNPFLTHTTAWVARHVSGATVALCPLRVPHCLVPVPKEF